MVTTRHCCYIMEYAATILVTVIPINAFKFKSCRFQMFVNEESRGRPRIGETRALSSDIRKTEMSSFPKIDKVWITVSVIIVQCRLLGKLCRTSCEFCLVTTVGVPFPKQNTTYKAKCQPSGKKTYKSISLGQLN